MDLSVEQVTQWIALSEAAFKARKWSDAKCNAEQVKAANKKIQLKIAEMSSTEEGRAKFMKQISGVWDSLLTPGTDTLGWE